MKFHCETICVKLKTLKQAPNFENNLEYLATEYDVSLIWVVSRYIQQRCIHFTLHSLKKLKPLKQSPRKLMMSC